MLIALYILIGIAVVAAILWGMVAALLKWPRTKRWTLRRIAVIKRRRRRVKKWKVVLFLFSAVVVISLVTWQREPLFNTLGSVTLGLLGFVVTNLKIILWTALILVSLVAVFAWSSSRRWVLVGLRQFWRPLAFLILIGIILAGLRFYRPASEESERSQDETVATVTSDTTSVSGESSEESVATDTASASEELQEESGAAEAAHSLLSWTTASWVGASLLTILGAGIILLSIFLRVSAKRKLKKKEWGEDKYELCRKIANAMLSTGLLMLFAGLGWMIWIDSGRSVLESFKAKWNEVTSGGFDVPWLVVLSIAIIGGTVVVWLLSWLLNRLFPLLFYYYRRRILLGSIALVAVLNAFFYWLLPQVWLGVATQPIFWIVQAVGIFLSPVVVNKAEKEKLLTATVIGLLFLGLGWLGATYGPGELANEVDEIHWSWPRKARSALVPEAKPEKPIATGTVSWVMPREIQRRYNRGRYSIKQIEIIRLDEEIFHYVTLCKKTGRILTECYWNRKTSKRGKWKIVDTLNGDEVKTGGWYLVQDPNNPLVYRGAWSHPVSSGGNDVPYKLVINP